MLQPALGPRPAVPRAFLLLSLCWGALAGLGWLLAGPVVLHSRWGAETLALTHVFTLGLLGNAMLGALLQFMPAAAGACLPRWTPGVLLPGLNLGLIVLLAHFLSATPHSARIAALLLGPGIGLPALMALFAATCARPRSLGRGLRLALSMLLLTLALGLWLLGLRSGWWAGPRLVLIDAHAALGLFGWVLGLLLCVGSLTLPMLQGTRALPARTVDAGGLAILASLGLGLGARMLDWPPWPALLVIPLLGACLGYWWLLARLPHRRNRPLRGFWLAGSLVLTAAALLWVAGPPQLPWGARPGTAVLAAVLALGCALPLLVMGMALEILAFLAWIDLQRGSDRGQRVPGVHSLLGDAPKWWVLLAQLGAGAAMLAAALAPQRLHLAAGLALLAAHLLALGVACLPARRASRFLLHRNLASQRQPHRGEIA
jgi:hypothetical protein